MHNGFARRPDSGERPGATIAVDLEEFVTFHRVHGRLTPDVGPLAQREGDHDVLVVPGL